MLIFEFKVYELIEIIKSNVINSATTTVMLTDDVSMTKC